MGLESIGRLLLIFGGFLAVLGVLFLLLGRSGLPLGRLPGDIVVHRGSFTFYFPLLTMVLLSILLTVVLNLIFRLLR